MKKSLGKSAGQIAGVQRMIEEERFCVDVLNQISAVRTALNALGIERPFLIYAYYRLAKREEAAVSKQFPGEFAAYKAEVPAFFPRISNSKNLQPS